jgi:hypothetical protein
MERHKSEQVWQLNALLQTDLSDLNNWVINDIYIYIYNTYAYITIAHNLSQTKPSHQNSKTTEHTWAGVSLFRITWSRWGGSIGGPLCFSPGFLGGTSWQYSPVGEPGVSSTIKQACVNKDQPTALLRKITISY